MQHNDGDHRDAAGDLILDSGTDRISGALRLLSGVRMTMPHLENCLHSETGWCLACVRSLWDDYDDTRIDAGKYERCLHAAVQRLQEVYSLRDVKAVGLLEVPNVIDELIAERDALRAALKRARAYAVNKQRKHPLGLRGFAAECGVSPTQLSQWTADAVRSEPDIVCSR